MMTSADDDEAPQQQPQQPLYKLTLQRLRPFLLTCVIGGILAGTYSACPICVFVILIFSALTINCLPGIPSPMLRLTPWPTL
jgi:hypothetical protein